MYGGDLKDYVDDFGMYDCYVTVCDLNKLVGFYDNGEAQYDNIETIEKKLGKDFIKDRIGLATGFFSDR